MTLDGTLEVTVEDQLPTFSLTVENTGSTPVTLEFRTGCTADFAVERDGAERWRLSENRMFTQVLSSEELAAGETVTYDARGDELEPGTYTAVGTLNATNRTCSASTTFTV